MAQQKKKSGIDKNTILLVVILVLSLMNSCNSCNNKSAISKNSKKIDATATVLKDNSEELVSIKQYIGELHTNLVEIIEDESELVLILEKEIDDKRIKSSGIKTLVNENRK